MCREKLQGACRVSGIAVQNLSNMPVDVQVENFITVVLTIVITKLNPTFLVSSCSKSMVHLY